MSEGRGDSTPKMKCFLKILGDTSPFFPGILLSRNPSEPQGNQPLENGIPPDQKIHRLYESRVPDCRSHEITVFEPGQMNWWLEFGKFAALSQWPNCGKLAGGEGTWPTKGPTLVISSIALGKSSSGSSGFQGWLS